MRGSERVIGVVSIPPPHISLVLPTFERFFCFLVLEYHFIHTNGPAFTNLSHVMLCAVFR